ncbi:YodC family protein [Marinomonas polaris]|uniref:YodC family protein n=1 Tax=Marinomonas polaris TaxID=293552 RepID=UPI0035154837
MSNKYNIGDIVKIKSGGPDMTINKVSINVSTEEFTGNYHCQWFAGKKLDTGIFPEDSLVPVTEEE